MSCSPARPTRRTSTRVASASYEFFTSSITATASFVTRSRPSAANTRGCMRKFMLLLPSGFDTSTLHLREGTSDSPNDMSFRHELVFPESQDRPLLGPKLPVH